MDKTEKILKALTEAHGVPGYEAGARAVMAEYLDPLGKVSYDGLGSVICEREGEGPRVMLAGHLDEVGFMVKHRTKDGFIKFTTLGGWWDQVLLGHRVIVKSHKGDVLGVIGAKPPHLLPRDQRGKIVKQAEMYIDIGASSLEELDEAGIREGDPVIPFSTFEVLANGKVYLSKAFDNRVGCALVVSAMKALKGEDLPNKLFGVGTVQEEVGLRGAQTSAQVINPDVAIVLESGIAGDVPGIKPEESSEKLGGGPTLGLYDRGLIPNLKLRDLVIATAEELEIPLQRSVMEGGATDAGRIHLNQAGVPSVNIAVPARHIHSHNAMIHRDDYDRAVKLVAALVRKLDSETVAGLRVY